MYFDASEHIALNTNYPRSAVEKIDKFLARPDVEKFDLSQLRQKTQVRDDAEWLLEEYIQRGVVEKYVVYLCPNHDISLEPVNQREGRCEDCDELHAFEDCDSRWLYKKIQEPDRVYSESTGNAVPPLPPEKDTPWYRDGRFIIASVMVPIIIVLIATFGDGVFRVINPTLSTPTATATSTPTQTPLSTATPTPLPTATSTSANTQPTATP